jgi:2-polyprenyl-3-methyl-5-hydroxy-6-metoxy-1,4-benzoquinol methylase
MSGHFRIHKGSEMPSQPEISEREILERMRDRVNEAKIGTNSSFAAGSVRPSRQYAFVADKSVPGYHLGRLRQHVEIVYQLQSAVGTLNPRPPGLVNQVIQRLKKFMSRALSWYTRPLHQFQGAVARAFDEDLQALESLQNQALAASELNEQRFDGIRNHLASLHEQIDELRELRIEERLRSQELKLRRVEAQRIATPKAAAQTSIVSHSSSAPKQADFNYFLFQEYHRGKESVIRQRQLEYIKHFKGRGPVWDLGCGRGEFLELLREHKIPAFGVDTDPDAIQLCREKGLSIEASDLFDFLEKAEDGTAGGIFAAQVIEHMPAELQLHLVDLSFRKLRPGAPLLLETINPECLFALTRNFFLDPTHIRPVHPEMLRFAFENKGFRDVQVQFSGPVEGKYIAQPSWPTDATPHNVTEALLALNHFAFGFQDYAIFGWRT